MTKPDAKILLERYWEECSNEGNVELVRELCADPLIRHDPGKETPLSHQEQIDRMQPEAGDRRLVADSTPSS